MTTRQNPSKFPMGKILITRRAKEVLDPAVRRQALGRHARGDWGDASLEDSVDNDWAVYKSRRILSVYEDGSVEFWIITESDRSLTLVALPADF